MGTPPQQHGTPGAASRDAIWPLVLLGTSIGIAYAALGVIVWFMLPDWTTRGQFGDMFGVVNALFSGGALVGVIYAVLLQRREPQLQRQELELTRRELERTASAQEESAQRLLEQTRIRTRLLNAQLVKDRLELYWETSTLTTTWKSNCTRHSTSPTRLRFDGTSTCPKSTSTSHSHTRFRLSTCRILWANIGSRRGRETSSSRGSFWMSTSNTVTTIQRSRHLWTGYVGQADRKWAANDSMQRAALCAAADAER